MFEFICTFNIGDNYECCVVRADDEEGAADQFYGLYPFYGLDQLERL
jgi:hypothetical protein